MTKVSVNRQVSVKRNYLVTALILLLTILVPLGSFAMSDQDKQNIKDMQLFLELINKHIEMINGYYQTANNSECVASFAVMEIKSLYEDKGDPQGAIRELRKLLDKTNSRPVRNVIRLQLNDLLKETGDRDAAQKNLEAIINENL